MFNGCPNLKYVQLDINDFSDVPDAKFQELFRNNPMLTTVYLGNSKITTITSDTFKGMPNVEELNLYSNPIEDLPDGVFDHLNNLKILRIDHNRLTEIRETTFNASTRQRLHQLDLSKNPYECTCKVQWFKRWLMDERKKFAKFPKGYVCASFSSSSCEPVRAADIMAKSLEASNYEIG
ncbi:hypothetical protein C0Q70_04821 [Pomacea canaliculata]|uniref:LRRCT domain-containing protein n=1 Tax=Pomacea canaliculata TaxID=400727 RepID=A0A2T7PJJ1_POMCA|nr:hypothetical protein C0Q70_04821 [Pomacea canaliculata]